LAEETMNAIERFQAAMRLEKPDRVPVAPILGTAAAATLLGQEAWKIFDQGHEAQVDLDFRVFDEYGGWDAMFPVTSPDHFRLGGLRVKDPNEENPEFQILEGENMTLEDYDLVAEMGWQRFVSELLIPRITSEAPSEYVRNMYSRNRAGLSRHALSCEQRGIFRGFGRWTWHPFFTFSLVRSLLRFTEDLFSHPDRVERALQVSVSEYIESSIRFCRSTGAAVLNCTEERAGGFFYSMDIFERFWMPNNMQIVDALWSEGIVTWFHLDTSWDKNIPYFKQLPRGSAILDFDGTTDIFAAKELMRNHLCIASDVHPALLSLGTPEEVAAYCRRLIDEVGGDGGLILSTGCFVPSTVKPDNFRAMIETGKHYELSK
jgi:hypothetical protein